jgi:hypothetical protein
VLDCEIIYIAHLRQECHNSIFYSFFELLVYKQTCAGALLAGIVSLRSLQNSPLESGSVVVALVENYSTSKPFKVSPEKSQILSCYTAVIVTVL